MASELLRPDHPAYPKGLTAIGGPELYLRGALPDLAGVAIVGTRSPSPAAVAFTRELAGALASARIAIWSGGAAGIDAAAHAGALDGGGVTVVVAGGGLDRPYPREHRGLFDRVIDGGGALLARVPDETSPTVPGFLARNAVLAAATVATVVIQAGIVSGARSTAAAARRLGRPLCVVPHAPWDEVGAGCVAELARGAKQISCAADVLDALSRAPADARHADARHADARHADARHARDPRTRGPRSRASRAGLLAFPALASEPADLAPDELAVLRALGGDAMCVDELCDRVGLSARAVSSAVLTLTLRAIVVEGPAGFVRRLPPSASSPVVGKR